MSINNLPSEWDSHRTPLELEQSDYIKNLKMKISRALEIMEIGFKTEHDGEDYCEMCVCPWYEHSDKCDVGNFISDTRDDMARW